MVARSSALVADDDDFFRIALRNILTDELRVPEVIETASLDEAIDALGSDTSIDLALFDLNMPGMDSFDGIKATRETFPDVTVVVVSASTDRRDVLRSLDAGAHGFVPKGEGVRRLVQAVRFVVDGNVYVPNFLPRLNGPPAADAPAVGAPHDHGTPRSHAHEGAAEVLENITPRQRDVLQLVVRGMSNKEIARSLSISESAVKFHVASLCGRLGVRNRVEIVAHAARLIE